MSIASAEATGFNVNEQGIFAHVDGPMRNENDAVSTSSTETVDPEAATTTGTALAIGSNAHANGSTHVETDANMSIASAGATDPIARKSAETVETIYDSDDEPIVLWYTGANFPTPYSDPVPVNFVKCENDLISGDKPYEETEVSRMRVKAFENVTSNCSLFFCLSGGS